MGQTHHINACAPEKDITFWWEGSFFTVTTERIEMFRLDRDQSNFEY